MQRRQMRYQLTRAAVMKYDICGVLKRYVLIGRAFIHIEPIKDIKKRAVVLTTGWLGVPGKVSMYLLLKP